MKTKARILAAALQRFNAQGTSNVSTNHIAEATGISPGNLYYHFSSKDEIIHAIFEQLYARWDEAFSLSDAPTLGQAIALVKANFGIMAEYRFIYREIIALLHHDEELRDRYLTIRQRGYEGFHQIFQALAAAGAIEKAQDAETIEKLADLCWLISEFWLATLEISGKEVSDAQMQRGIGLMMQVLKPYLA